MKQKAILYTRVNTCDQIGETNSNTQREQLVSYCEKNGIEVEGIYHDTASAKTFDRPEWKKLIKHINANKGQANLLLFVRWDRFSRNVAQAYTVIEELRKCGIEAQAIEQPDTTIPENKILLAIYLSSNEKTETINS